jgi:hypothetical protein
MIALVKLTAALSSALLVSVALAASGWTPPWLF